MAPYSQKRVTPLRLIIVITVSLVVSNLHFLTPIHIHALHLIYDRLCYFPIIVAAFWFGFWGGLITGIIMSVMHLTHIGLQWGGGYFNENLYQTLEAGVHVFIGIVTGFLSERFLRASEKLHQSYQELREKTGQIFHVEEQLRRTERIQALAELTAGMAHEIRTPLASITGAADILSTPGLKPEDREEFTAILRKESLHLKNVVNEFLNFARPQIRKPLPCRIEEVLDLILELTSQQRRSHDIRVEKQYAENLPFVNFDPDQLKQVFVNLIHNAIQAMPEGGTLTISCQNCNGHVECIIEDSGLGIPEEILPRIFDPFFTTRPSGTGLGLSIVQKILHHHQSSIEAENRLEGGARFIVCIPRREKE